MNQILQLDGSQLARIQRQLPDRDKAQFLLFRIMGPALQQRIAELVDMSSIPRVFIHGNPHLDNYARTSTGTGMIDFDRSRLGPYVWDVVRFFASLALRRTEGKKTRLQRRLLEAFMEGYLSRLYNSDLFYSTPEILRAIEPDPEQLTTRAYIGANLNWAKRMRRNPIPVDDPRVRQLLLACVENSGEKKLLEQYSFASAGTVIGSLGKEHFILELVPAAMAEKYDDILLDIKETYTEEDDEWFSSPVEHHGLRMIKASNLYAPGVETRLSYCTLDGRQYWCRQIPPFKAKLPASLEPQDIDDVAYCVGTQLGRGHRRSCKEFEPGLVERHFLHNQGAIVDLVQFLNKELLLGFEYLERSEELRSSFQDSFDSVA